jgi:hypothetical protein
MHKSAIKCNETVGKWCKNKHGASKIIDTLETYQAPRGIAGMDAEEKKALITSSWASALSSLMWSRMSSPARCAQMLQRWS